MDFERVDDGTQRKHVVFSYMEGVATTQYRLMLNLHLSEKVPSVWSARYVAEPKWME